MCVCVCVCDSNEVFLFRIVTDKASWCIKGDLLKIKSLKGYSHAFKLFFKQSLLIHREALSVYYPKQKHFVGITHTHTHIYI